MKNYLIKAIEDFLFLRIVFVLYSIPFYLIASLPIYEFNSFAETPALFILPLVFLLTATFLVYVGLFSKDKLVEKYSDAISDGGELIGVIFVLLIGIVAIPIWEMIKRFRR